MRDNAGEAGDLRDVLEGQRPRPKATKARPDRAKKKARRKAQKSAKKRNR